MEQFSKRIRVAFMFVLLSALELYSQSPTHIDTRRKEPNAFTLDDILLYIVAPLVLVGLFPWYRYHLNKKRLEKEKQKEKESS